MRDEGASERLGGFHGRAVEQHEELGSVERGDEPGFGRARGEERAERGEHAGSAGFVEAREAFDLDAQDGGGSVAGAREFELELHAVSELGERRSARVAREGGLKGGGHPRCGGGAGLPSGVRPIKPTPGSSPRWERAPAFPRVESPSGLERGPPG